MYRYLAQKDFANAYRVACLGVTDADWRQLAMDSLMALEIRISRKAFIRVHDSKFLDLISMMSTSREDEGSVSKNLIPEALAHQVSSNLALNPSN